METQLCSICEELFETDYPFPPEWVADGKCFCSLFCMEEYNRIFHDHVCGRDSCGDFDWELDV